MEVQHMPSSRWLAVPIAIGAALIAGAPVASTDPVNDGYLAQLRAIGFTWPPDHDAALIGMAFLVCDDLGWGWTPAQIAQHVHANLDQRSVGFGNVASMVDLARATYCPNQRCWAPHC
jgi:hypothetical protein